MKLNTNVGVVILPILRYHLLKQDVILKMMDEMGAMFDIDGAESGYKDTLQNIVETEIEFLN